MLYCDPKCNNLIESLNKQNIYNINNTAFINIYDNTPIILTLVRNFKDHVYIKYLPRLN